MIFFEKKHGTGIVISVVSILMLIASSGWAQEDHNREMVTNSIPSFQAEDVHGNQVMVPDTTDLIVSVLPKPPGKKQGMQWLATNRKWVQLIRDQNNDVSIVAIVVPYKTGFLFGRVIKSKLKDEPYPVLIDEDSRRAALFLNNEIDNPPYLYRINKNGKVLEVENGRPSEQAVLNLLSGEQQGI